MQLLVRELPPGQGHSAQILPLIQDVLSEAALTLGELDASPSVAGPADSQACDWPRA